jgi:hypothetical protein
MLAERGLGEHSVVDEPCVSDVQALARRGIAALVSADTPAKSA